jgi:hypothetical protein
MSSSVSACPCLMLSNGITKQTGITSSAMASLKLNGSKISKVKLITEPHTLHRILRCYEVASRPSICSNIQWDVAPARLNNLLSHIPLPCSTFLVVGHKCKISYEHEATNVSQIKHKSASVRTEAKVISTRLRHHYSTQQ